METVRKSKFIAIFFVVTIIFVALAFRSNNSPTPTPTATPTAKITTTTPKVVTPQPEAGQPSTETPENPTSLNLLIPFTPQAPTGNWDLLHNEACEEASAIMAAAYFSGDTRTKIPAEEVEKQISDLTTWLDQRFGYHLNTTAKETAQMIEGFYGLKAEVFSNYTLQDIKNQLNLNHIVILPVNGQMIGNPYYKQPGPIYHMLVVRGYDGTKIITNDSGTKRGENYSYSFSTIQNSAADWDHATDTIDESKTVMIVVSK